MSRWVIPVLLVLAAVFLTGCGGSATNKRVVPPSGGGGAKPAVGRFLHVDAAHHAVDLTLIAADTNANNGFNFDGYGRGQLLVQVPRGWRVTVHCRNGGVQLDSCGVVSGPRPTTLAFPGASTPNPVSGLAGGAQASFSFTATRAGVYRLASLVPGHEEAREWALLEVTRSTRPTISARPGA